MAKYISPAECQLSYNPLLMALLWETLATREVKLLHASLRDRFKITPGCAWVNYVRCHDDIGWTFDDADAAGVDINGFYHRQFLNAFYTGRFAGSFARGLPFQENPKTGDARISGTAASLAGLEKALREQDPAEIDYAVQRILLIHSVILSIGGIPLLYLGDETAMLNDYSYANDPAKAGDSRWVHRPFADWQRSEQRHDASYGRRPRLPGPAAADCLASAARRVRRPRHHGDRHRQPTRLRLRAPARRSAHGRAGQLLRTPADGCRQPAAHPRPGLRLPGPGQRPGHCPGQRCVSWSRTSSCGWQP